MPLQYIKYINSHCVLGVWRLTETENFFYPSLPKLVQDNKNLESIHHEKRRTEWLAGRYLVMELTQRLNLPFDGIWTDEFNKPHLTLDNGSISLSHATPFVVAILDTRSPCGIDVERLREKLIPLSPKFLSKHELSLAEHELENLAIFWGAKEALYKLHGRKSLIFKENLFISEFKKKASEAIFKGKIETSSKKTEYWLYAERFDEFVLVFTHGET